MADPKADLVALIESLDARACNGDLNQLERADAEKQLFALWRSHEDDERNWTPSAYTRLGSFFRRSDPLLAYEVFAAGLGNFPASQSLRYQEGLTLVRLGAPGRALEVATGLACHYRLSPSRWERRATSAQV